MKIEQDYAVAVLHGVNAMVRILQHYPRHASRIGNPISANPVAKQFEGWVSRLRRNRDPSWFLYGFSKHRMCRELDYSGPEAFPV